MIGRQWVLDRGLVGFLTVAELRERGLAQVPDSPGVYAVVWGSTDAPEFLERSTGYHRKGKDPSVTITTLQAAWVRDSRLLYVGKAGFRDRKPSIRQRLRQYLDFGEGKPIGHWGGRYVWQLARSSELLVAWRATPGQEPRQVESGLIAEFLRATGRLPFANLKQ